MRIKVGNGWALKLVLMLLLLTGAGCNSVKVRSDYDPDTDFSVYQSFAWVIPTYDADVEPVVLEGEDLLTRRVQQAVDQNLQSRAYHRTTLAEADFLVTFDFSVQVKQDVSYHTTGGVNHAYYGRSGYYRRGGVHTGIGYYARVDEYEEGTLLIDFLDARSGDLIWRGTSTSRVLDMKTPEQREQRVQQLVDAILAQFPPHGHGESAD